VLGFSNVFMGAASTAGGPGTILFAGGPSAVAAGAGYAAGVTELGGSGTLDFDATGTTVALRLSGGTRSGTGTLTVGSGQSTLEGGTFADTGTTAWSAGSVTTISGLVELTSGATVRFNGATTWSAGDVYLNNAGVLENAGTLTVTGTVSVFAVGATGVRALRTLAAAATLISGTLSVGASLENDGTLRVLDGGTLSQFNTAASVPESSGAFIAENTGLLSLSNVIMGAASSASGTGTIRFANGPSTVTAGAGYAAGITEVASGGALTFNDDGTTGALLLTGGTRGGAGTLTVGNGASALASGAFADTGATVWSPGSLTTLDGVLELVSGPTVRLGGTTVWSGGSVYINNAGSFENAGTLSVTGDVAVYAVGVAGAREFHNRGGSLTVQAGRSLALAPTLQLDGGVLGGSGTILATVLNTGGTVAPDLLSIDGDYTQGAGGTLRAEIGPQSDLLTVNGTATLAGSLQLVNAAGFDPPAASAFRIVDAATRTGTFATVTGTQVKPEKAYVVGYEDDGVVIRVGLGPAATSAPSISGGSEPGHTITCSPGAWSGSPNLTYAWLRDGTPIASGPEYTLALADAGHEIVCRVTATNEHGTASADSSPLRPTAPPTPSPTAFPTVIPTPTPASEPPAPPPVTGRSVNVAAERGTVTVRLPNGRTVPVDEATQIPTGSVIDTRAGAIRLDSRGAQGRTETGVFYDGLFKVTQSTGSKPVTQLELVEPLSCPKANRATGSQRKKKKRRLWGNATGNFRTRGRYGSAVNTGTKWMVEDRCDRTIFKVEQGTIAVSRNGSRRTVRVKAGRRYTVRRP
jgi:hypothetical protein